MHEWKYDLKDRPQLVVDEFGMLAESKPEPIENLITWIFDEGTFKPTAKIINDETYSIITDYLGTPVEMYNSKGQKTWQVEYDIYGKVCKLVKGSLNDCPFRYQEQYEDPETGLYYNRFRYYNPDSETYISQDPIGLAGKMPNLYSYVRNSNTFVDPYGLLEEVVFPKNNVIAETTIQMQGSRSQDFKAANSNVGLNGKRGKPTGNAHKEIHGDVVWHHVDYDPETNTAKMQLVSSADHNASKPHKGFEDHTGTVYESPEAKAEAKKLNAKCP
ncbi:RHS repeat-associated core domain-containing protein [Aquimarina longa]|uniref:RHS repeat-associated core domain-containing protein n=1 Tax=Aquimarina longa TaxID=1080221 RepID=UPI000781EBFE|nr:RHS repeat-associated core domain-containing protein [Aquimarina longa]